MSKKLLSRYKDKSSVNAMKSSKEVCPICKVISWEDVSKIRLCEIHNKMKKSSEHFSRLMENMNEMALNYDVNGNITFINKQCCRVLGYTPEEVIGKNILDFAHPKSRALGKRRIDKRLKSGKGGNVVVAALHKNGETRYIRFIAAAINEGDKITGCMLIGEDVTEKKLTEKALKDSEEKFRTLFNNSDAAIFVQEIGRTEEPGQYIEINDTACKLWGYSREEFLKMTPRDIEDPESSIELPHVIEEFFQKGKCTFQRITIAKDGTYIPVEITAIKFYLQGRYVMASIVRDLRAIRESEEALKKSEAKYKNLFKNMHNAFGYFKVVYDRNKNIIDFIYLEVNNAYEKLVDTKREELIGKSFFQTFFDLKNYKEFYLQIVANAVIESQPFESKEFFIGGNINKWCQVYIYSPEEDCFACIFSDITEQKKNAEELREAKEAAEAASNAKSTFLANVSHEIRTPLNSIIGLVDLTLLTNLTEDQRDSLETVKHSANSLLLIINDILDFSKIEAGKMTVDRTPFNLRNLIESSIKMHQVNVKDKNLILTWNMDANVPEEIIGDANKLEQVINNILGNAIKFTEEGRVILSVKVIENVEDFVEIVFAITDTGIGIAEEDRIKLFKEFSQVDGSITRRYGGTGLGLIISKGLIKIMGGIIGVESQKDKGSTFYFTVKVQRTSVKAAQPKVNVNYNNESKLFYNEEIDKNFENSVKFLSGKYHKNEKMNSYSYEFTSPMKDKCKNNKPISDNNQLLEFTKGYVKEIKEALEEGNFLKAEKAAKQIKNISSCAGIKNIKMLAFAIELAVRRRDLEEGKKFLKKLEETY